MYILGDWEMTEAEITKNIKNSIKKLGGQFIKLHAVSRWKYFPHVTTEALQNGFYEKLDQLQGQNHTYYIGELPTFSIMEMTAAYAKELVENIFKRSITSSI